MIIDEDADGNTLLFHSINQLQQNIVLDDSLYPGVRLVGKIKNNTFYFKILLILVGLLFEILAYRSRVTNLYCFWMKFQV